MDSLPRLSPRFNQGGVIVRNVHLRWLPSRRLDRQSFVVLEQMFTQDTSTNIGVAQRISNLN